MTRPEGSSSSLFGAVLTALAAPVAVVNGYLAVLTAAAFARRSVAPQLADPGRVPHRLIVLIPAHDEAAIIGSTIESMLGQDYPAERFEVHVVADNCTDATADVVRRHGGCVHERADLVRPGKGPA